MLHDPIPQDLLDYSRELFAPEDSTLQDMTAAAREFGMPVGWEITPDVGRLFQLLCQGICARRIVEFGTLAGHSALWFARAVSTQGRVISIELNPDYAAFARRQLELAGVGDIVDVRVGAALDILPELSREVEFSAMKFDAIFLDADKAHYPEFLDWVVTVLRPGGLLFADNVLRSDSWKNQTLLDPLSDDPRIIAIREFNKRLAHHPAFTSLIVPMRAGVAVALFRG